MKKLLIISSIIVATTSFMACGKVTNNNSSTLIPNNSTAANQNNIIAANQNNSIANNASNSTVNSNNKITIEEAKSIALKHSNLDESQVSFMKAKYEFDDGIGKYEIEFYYNNNKYEYEINAKTGDIISYDYDIEKHLTSQQINDKITIEDDWGNYPKGVIKALKDLGCEVQGMDIVLYSNIPDGAGLSSSAALEVLMAYIILYLENPEQIDRVEIAKLCQRVENEFVGVNCGIMDQFAVAIGKKDKAILLDCASLYYEYAPLNLGEYSLVIMSTNKRRELADSKYNERRAECEKALEIINNNKEEKLENLCQATLEEVENFITDETIKKKSKTCNY